MFFGNYVTALIISRSDKLNI